MFTPVGANWLSIILSDHNKVYTETLLINGKIFNVIKSYAVEENLITKHIAILVIENI